MKLSSQMKYVPHLTPAQKLLYRKIVFILAAGFCLTPWASPPVALMLGILLALTHENPFHRISRPASKYLLEASVVMLGFGMNLAVVLTAGASGDLSAVGSISFIGLFLLASISRTFIPQIVAWSPAIERISGAGLTLTLFLVGAGLSQRMLRAVGWKPMLQGVVLWIFIIATSLGVIMLVVR